MDNLPVIIAEVSVAPSGESFRNKFFFCACFRRFTVGSTKTRQITLWAVGLITTNHDMRPIRKGSNIKKNVKGDKTAGSIGTKFRTHADGSAWKWTQDQTQLGPYIGLYREISIAIQKESGDSNGGNV